MDEIELQQRTSRKTEEDMHKKIFWSRVKVFGGAIRMQHSHKNRKSKKKKSKLGDFLLNFFIMIIIFLSTRVGSNGKKKKSNKVNVRVPYVGTNDCRITFV